MHNITSYKMCHITTWVHVDINQKNPKNKKLTEFKHLPKADYTMHLLVIFL